MNSKFLSVLVGLFIFITPSYASEKFYTDIVFAEMGCEQPPVFSFCKRQQREPFEVVSKNYFKLEKMSEDIKSKTAVTSQEFKSLLDEYRKEAAQCIYYGLPQTVAYKYQMAYAQMLKKFETCLDEKIKDFFLADRAIVGCLPTQAAQNVFELTFSAVERVFVLAGTLASCYAAFGPSWCIKSFYGLFQNFYMAMAAFNRCQINVYDKSIPLLHPFFLVGISLLVRIPSQFFYLYVRLQSNHLQNLRIKKSNCCLAKKFLQEVVQAHIKCLQWASGTKVA